MTNKERPEIEETPEPECSQCEEEIEEEEEEEKKPEKIRVDLKSKIYAIHNIKGYVIETKETLFKVCWDVLMFDQLDPKTGKSEADDLKTKDARTWLGMELMRLNSEKDVNKQFYEYTRDTEQDKIEVTKLILERVKKQKDGWIYGQVEAYFRNYDNPLKKVFDKRKPPDYEFIEEKIQTIEDIEVAKVIIRDIVLASDVVERERERVIGQFFREQGTEGIKGI